jgi:hypothetical protein
MLTSTSTLLSRTSSRSIRREFGCRLSTRPPLPITLLACKLLAASVPEPSMANARRPLLPARKLNNRIRPKCTQARPNLVARLPEPPMPVLAIARPSRRPHTSLKLNRRLIPTLLTVPMVSLLVRARCRAQCLMAWSVLSTPTRALIHDRPTSKFFKGVSLVRTPAVSPTKEPRLRFRLKRTGQLRHSRGCLSALDETCLSIFLPCSPLARPLPDLAPEWSVSVYSLADASGGNSATSMPHDLRELKMWLSVPHAICQRGGHGKIQYHDSSRKELHSWHIVSSAILFATFAS